MARCSHVTVDDHLRAIRLPLSLTTNRGGDGRLESLLHDHRQAASDPAASHFGRLGFSLIDVTRPAAHTPASTSKPPNPCAGPTTSCSRATEVATATSGTRFV